MAVATVLTREQFQIRSEMEIVHLELFFTPIRIAIPATFSKA